MLLIYIATTENMDKSVRRRVARRTVLVAGMVIAAVVFILLPLVGITVVASVTFVLIVVAGTVIAAFVLALFTIIYSIIKGSFNLSVERRHKK